MSTIRPFGFMVEMAIEGHTRIPMRRVYEILQGASDKLPAFVASLTPEQLQANAEFLGFLQAALAALEERR